MKIQELIREFKYNSVKLPDPNPAFTLVQVRDFFANVYPEIISADIEGPEQVGDKQVYSFRRAVGTKGGAILAPAAVAFLTGFVADKDSVSLQELAQVTCHLMPIARITETMLNDGWVMQRRGPHKNLVFVKSPVPTTQAIADLQALASIGWFDCDPADLNAIHYADAILASPPSAGSSALLDRLLRLHATHCSRSQEAAA
ncbi:MAG TPA: PRTRC system protein C [Duganella sp.]|nr:PRTRC system protein C [Duganella sp.]